MPNKKISSITNRFRLGRGWRVLCATRKTPMAMMMSRRMIMQLTLALQALQHFPRATCGPRESPTEYYGRAGKH